MAYIERMQQQHERLAPAAAPDDLQAEANELARLRDERDALRAKLDEVARVLGADPAKIVHDARNVMNELGLLRKLAELED